MQWKPSIRIALATSFFLFIFITSAQAQDSEYYSSYHSDYGLKLVQDGKTGQAIKEFVKSLLADPSNQLARENLKDILKDPKKRMDAKRLALLRFVEHVEYIDFLKSRIHALNTSNDMISKFLYERSAFDAAVIEVVQLIEEELEKKKSTFHFPSGITRSFDLNEDIDLDVINKEYARQKGALYSHITFLEQGNKQLRSLKIDVVSRLGLLRKEGFNEQFTDQIQSIQTQLAKKDVILKKQEGEIVFFNTELENVRSQFEMLQEELRRTDERVAGLTKQLAGMTLRLYEKDKLLADKESHLKAVETEMVDAKEKLNLVHRILQEKDEQIDLLEERLVSVQEAPSAGKRDGSDNEVRLFEQLKDLSENYDRAVKQLEEKDQQLTLLSKNVAIKDSKIVQLKKQNEREVFQLKAAIEIKDIRLKKYHELLATRGKELSEMEGVIRIYRDKLKEVNALLHERSQKLDYLEKQFMDLSTKISDFQKKELLGRSLSVLPVIIGQSSNK